MNILTFRKIPSAAAAALVGIAIVATSVAAHAGHRTTSVDAFSTKSYTYSAWSGERFDVSISGDGDTDLDLRVRDPHGDIVCRGLGPTDDESCTVYARSAGDYKVEIVNLGSVYNVVDVWAN
jgi:hypothetical protein